jgi:hypothetical protein
VAKRPLGDVVVLLPGILGSVLTRDGKDVSAPTPGAIADDDLDVAVLDLTDHRCHPAVPTVTLGAGRALALSRSSPGARCATG